MKLKNKKSAFTLAEVLITLAIIGVVAAITIPTLIQNTQKQEIVGKVKEAYSILSQATQQINDDCGGNISGCLSDPNAVVSDSTVQNEVANLYKQKLYLAKDCTDGTTTECFANVLYTFLNNNPYTNFDSLFPTSRIFLKNGTSVAFGWYGPTFGPPIYFDVYIDINGTKKPNQVGKDTFLFYYDINKKSITPHLEVDCGEGTNNGMGCAAKILQENAISYY